MGALIGIILIVSGAGAVGFGLLWLFTKDAAWDLTVWSRQVDGIPSKRTDAWEAATLFRGTSCVVASALVLGLGIFMMGTR